MPLQGPWSGLEAYWRGVPLTDFFLWKWEKNLEIFGKASTHYLINVYLKNGGTQPNYTHWGGLEAYQTCVGENGEKHTFFEGVNALFHQCIGGEWWSINIHYSGRGPEYKHLL